MMVHKDWGYSVENVLFVRLNGVPSDRLNLIKTEFERIPSVTNVSMSTNIPLYGMNGDGVSDPETKKNLFLYKLMGADKDFLKTLQISLLSGENFETDGSDPQSVLVNETFIKRMQALDFPVDKPFVNVDGERRIIGVVKDFQLLNLYKETEPVIICSVDPIKGVSWLQQFIVKIPLSVSLFVLGSLSLLFILSVCICLRSWKVANDNPVQSIKLE